MAQRLSWARASWPQPCWAGTTPQNNARLSRPHAPITDLLRELMANKMIILPLAACADLWA